MTEAQAWREVARRWAEEPHKQHRGLCCTYCDVTGSDDAYDRRTVTGARVRRFIPYELSIYIYPMGKHPKLRVLTACFLATIAEVGE